VGLVLTQARQVQRRLILVRVAAAQGTTVLVTEQQVQVVAVSFS